MDENNKVKILMCVDEYGEVTPICVFENGSLNTDEKTISRLMGIVKKAVNYDENEDEELYDEVVDTAKQLSGGYSHEFNGEYMFYFREVEMF
jgi:hypothetical protein